MKTKDRNRRRFVGGGAGDDLLDLTSLGVGGVGGGFGGSVVERLAWVGLWVAVASMGAWGTPATVPL